MFVAAQGVLLAVLVCNRYRGVPAVFLILCAVAVAVHVITGHTPFGRALLAIGGNEEAARLSGIPVERTITAAYALMGLIVALTGFLQTSYAGAATVSIGELMELDAIAACVIGGTSLKGGRGSVLGTLFGSAVMATLLNGMTLLAITPEWKLIARGTALVAAVLFDVQGSASDDLESSNRDGEARLKRKPGRSPARASRRVRGAAAAGRSARRAVSICSRVVRFSTITAWDPRMV